MKVLSIQEVTRENWHATLGLTVFPEQQRFLKCNLLRIPYVSLE